MGAADKSRGMRKRGMLQGCRVAWGCAGCTVWPWAPGVGCGKIKLLQVILVHSPTDAVMLLSGNVCGQGLAPALSTV